MPIISPKIPSGLEELMRGLAKSVIKENPHNIYEFAAEYFENLLKERDGSCDQSYKKFATYKVYKKNKSARLNREKKNSNDVSDVRVDNGFKKDGTAVNYGNDFEKNDFSEEKSIEEIILPISSRSLQSPPKTQASISSESEIKDRIQKEASIEVDGAPLQTGNSEDDDIKNMVLDEDMAQAALKIQSSFRGHKARKEMKEKNLGDDVNESIPEDEEKTASEYEEKAEHFEDLQPVNNEDTEKHENDESDVPKGSDDENQTDAIVETEEAIDSNDIKETLQCDVDDDIANMVLDDDMEQAALKIQSSFRGHKVRRDMNSKPIEETVINEVENTSAIDEEASVQLDDSALAESIEPENSHSEIVHLDDDAENEEKDEEIIKEIIENKISTEGEAIEEIVIDGNILEEDSENLPPVDENVEVEPLNEENIVVEEVESKTSVHDLTIDESFKNLDVVSETVDGDECTQIADDISDTVADGSLIELVEEVTAGEENKAEDNFGVVEETEIEETLPNNNAEETAKEEMCEQEITEAEDNSIRTAVMRQDSESLKELEEVAPNNEEFSPQGVEEEILNENIDDEILVDEPIVLEELTEETVVEEEAVIDDELESTIKFEDIIDSADKDNVLETVNENEPQENEPIETIDEEKTVEVNEQELQEGLNESQNESENGNLDIVEATEEELESIDGIPVIEKICEKKSIEYLESDQLNVESEIDENALGESSLLEIENNQPNLEYIQADNLKKSQSGDIEYSSLKESISEAAESVDDADNKSRDITDEKSIDGDTTGSKQNSVDEIHEEEEEEKNIQPAPKEVQEESFVHSSTVDEMEMNVTQQATEVEEKLFEETESKAVESILQNEISPIELMDEVVNEFAGTVANELFCGNVEQVEQETDLIKSLEGENEEKPSEKIVEPRMSVENPLKEIETPKSIDLTQENVQVSQDELEPIMDEILQPEKEDSEIPEESQAPIDQNVPTVSMEDKAPSVENEEQLPQDETEEKSDPQPTKVEDDVTDMVLDEEMEDAALKIQAAFRGHQVRKEQTIEQKSDSQVKSEENVEQKSETETNVVIDQCSEENEEVQEHEEIEQQDTSVDVEDIQESETVDQEETQEESHEEEENVEEETAVESAENETAEEAGDDPNGTPEDEAESTEQPQNNDDDDVANMVLDEEMEQAALKIQSTFRGHKTRKDVKKDEPQGEASTSDEPQEQKDSVQDVDDEIANMVLDDEMEQAALKIQSTFRGHQTRKDIKKDESTDDNENNEEEKPEEKKDEEAPKEEEETTASSSTDKSAKELQDEEDIANIVMDAEMEQTALKIQSAFRGKIRKKATKDSDETTGSSGDDQTEDEEEEESPAKSDEDPFKPNEMSLEKSYDEERGSDNSAAHYSTSDDARYFVERHDTSYENEKIVLNTSTDDLNLMQGGGIFPEPSGESSDNMLTGSSGDDKEPGRNSSYEKLDSDNSRGIDEPISKQQSVDPLNDEQVIENFDFVANKDTAEAMYYSLKKNELETLKQLSSEKQLSLKQQQPSMEEEQALSMETMTNLENQSMKDEDDDDVVIGAVQPKSAKRLKYGMSMDDRLLGSILSKDYSKKPRKDGYPDDGFDPLLEATMRNQNFLEKLHEMSNSDEDKNVSYNDYPGDDEDQFDDFYNSNNIRQKMMASSISIADSDYFEPTGNKSIIDDDKIRTALETIHSSDSESTIASAATKIQAGDRTNARRNNNMQYSSIGNAAIDRSLDEFIQSQELRIEKFDEEFEGYNSPPPRKQESEDWTDDTTTYTDSDKKVGVGGIIDIKVEQKSFLTVDERRRTLHREDAIQRNSTQDSSKSANVSSEKLLDKETPAVEATVVVGAIAPQDSVTDTEISVPIIDLTAKSKSSSQSQAKPHRMKRQHTMPVQIQTDVIRVVPKHLRKRIKSADGDKKKRVSK